MGVTDHDPGGPAGAPLARPGPQGPNTLPSMMEHFQRQGPRPPPRVERVGLPCPGEGPEVCAHRALRARLSFPTSFPEGDPAADDRFFLGWDSPLSGPLCSEWGALLGHRGVPQDPAAPGPTVWHWTGERTAPAQGTGRKAWLADAL